MTADREQLRRDLEQFAAFAPMLGQDAKRETALDVVVGVDPAFAGLVATTIVEGEWWIGDEPVGERWVDLQRALRRQRRRHHLRRAARARKARRGWA